MGQPILLVGLSIVLLLYGCSFVQQRREREIAKLLKSMRDPEAVSAMMDTEIKQARRESEFFMRFRRR